MSKLDSLEKRLAGMRRKAGEKAEQGGHVAAALVGVSGVAYLRGRFESLRQIGGMDSDLLLGGSLVALGMAEVAGKWSDETLFAGVGILSPALERRLFALGDSHS